MFPSMDRRSSIRNYYRWAEIENKLRFKRGEFQGNFLNSPHHVSNPRGKVEAGQSLFIVRVKLQKQEGEGKKYIFRPTLHLAHPSRFNVCLQCGHLKKDPTAWL
jgi:hypothetical protein